MKHMLSVFVILPLLVLATTAAQARLIDTPASTPKKAACDPNWKTLQVPTSDPGTRYGGVFARIAINKKGTVFVVTNQWKPADDRSTSLALLYWQPQPSTGQKVVTHIPGLNFQVGVSAVSFSGGRLVIGGRATGSFAPSASKHPFLVEWDGRKLVVMPLPSAIKEGLINDVDGNWAVGGWLRQLPWGQDAAAPLVLHKTQTGWEQIVVAGGPDVSNIDGHPGVVLKRWEWGNLFEVKSIGSNRAFFLGEFFLKNLALSWDGTVFAEVPVPKPDVQLPKFPKKGNGWEIRVNDLISTPLGTIAATERGLMLATATSWKPFVSATEARRLFGSAKLEFSSLAANERWITAVGSANQEDLVVMKRRICGLVA